MTTTYQMLKETEEERAARIAAEDAALERVSEMLERHRAETDAAMEALRQRHNRERETLQSRMDGERLEHTRRVLDDVIEAMRQREAGGLNPALASRITLVNQARFNVPGALQQITEAARKQAVSGTVPVSLVGFAPSETPGAKPGKLYAVIDVSDVVGT